MIIAAGGCCGPEVPLAETQVVLHRPVELAEEYRAISAVRVGISER